uniref:Uncharacterized protein n=1 Tax=Callithrix jacchus TaxID=9483 RepID=A0A5F4WGM9_CALJA
MGSVHCSCPWTEWQAILQVPQQASAVCSQYQNVQHTAIARILRTLRAALEEVIAFLGPRTPSSTPHSHPETMLRALMESGAGMPEQDKDPRVQEKPDDQKGGPEGTRDAWSAFRPLRDSGGLSPFVSRPRPLQRDLHTQRSEIPSDKTSQPSGMSCCIKRNSIFSSYSSTGGFPWLKRRKGPASSHCRLPLTSSKTVSEVSPQAVSQGQAQCEKAADSAPGEKPASRSGSLTSQASRPRRRKFPLLPRRRGEPLMLPSPLQLGFRVTAEDLNLEKNAEIMCLNSALQGEEKSLWECRASLLSHALSSLATGTSSLPAVPKAPRTDAQQERCKSQDGLDPMALKHLLQGPPLDLLCLGGSTSQQAPCSPPQTPFLPPLHTPRTQPRPHRLLQHSQPRAPQHTQPQGLPYRPLPS